MIGKGLIGLALLLAAGSARAEVIWRGDFETGTIKQWTAPGQNTKRWTAVADPVRQGKWAGRVELHAEDVGAGSQRRAELAYAPKMMEGNEQFLAFSLQPSATEPLQPGSHWITYFESETIYKPLMTFDADGKNLSFSVFLKDAAGKSPGTNGRLWRGQAAWTESSAWSRWR